MTGLTAQNWQDQHSLINVGLRYARGIDDRDFDLILSCFTEDAVWFNHVGHANIEAAMREFLSRCGATQHITTNFEPMIEGDAGAMRSLFMATHCQLATGAPFVIGGRYIDRFTVDRGEWRIERRVIHVDWRSGELADRSE